MGVFLLGASAGALLQSLRYRSVIASCRQVFENETQPCGADPIGGSTDSSAAATGVSCASSIGLLFPVRGSVSADTNVARFEMWSHTLLTCLGAPIWIGEERRKLTMAERVEWLQARTG